MIFPLCVSDSLVCDMSVSMDTSYLLYFFFPHRAVRLCIFFAPSSSIALFFSPSRFNSCTSLSYPPVFTCLSRINIPPHFSPPSHKHTHTQMHNPPTHSVYLVNVFYLPVVFIHDCDPDWLKVKMCLSQVVVYHFLLSHSGSNHNYKGDRIYILY